MKTVQFDHAIGDEVSIAALDLPGRVVALLLDSEGQSYKIAYWSDGVRKVDWMFGWEIKHV